jgi:prolyl oligopeptidase
MSFILQKLYNCKETFYLYSTMKTFALVLLFLNCSKNSPAQSEYPITKTVDSADLYFGRIYKDPYRWLEKMQDKEVKEWFKDQAAYTNAILNKITGQQELIEEWEMLGRNKRLFYFNRSFVKGSHFFQKHDPLVHNALLFSRKTSQSSDEVVFDTRLAIDSTWGFSFESATISPDGKKAVLSFLKNGTEISVLKILNIERKTILKDSIYPCIGNSVRWCFDNDSFIYTSLETDDNNSSEFFRNNKVKIHRLGHHSIKDKIYFSIVDFPELKINPERRPNGEISHFSENYIFADAGNDDGIFVGYCARKKDLKKAHIKWKSIGESKDELINVFAYRADKIFVISKKQAKNYKLIATSLVKPDWTKPEIIIEEKRDLVLEDFKMCKDYILAIYTDGLNSRLFKYYFKDKRVSEVRLPEIGTLSVELVDKNANEFYVSIATWARPRTEYKLDLVNDEFVLSDFNRTADYPQDYLNIDVEEIAVKGHDGAMIPFTILSKKGLKKDGESICLMDSYGGYGYSMKPSFSTKRNSLIRKGIIIAIPHVRGGGEKGEEWYKGGFKLTKSNSWKDFNSCAEYLITNKYTSAKKLIAHAGSLGCILVAGAINEKPDLYRVAISGSGVLNSLRIERMPNGDYLTGELGSVKDSTECIALEKMDGLFQVSKSVEYPAVLCYVGMNDPRVSPWQSAKFIGALQNLKGQSKPFLLQIDFEGGHGPSNKMYAAHISFALWQCGHSQFQIK